MKTLFYLFKSAVELLIGSKKIFRFFFYMVILFYSILINAQLPPCRNLVTDGDFELTANAFTSGLNPSCTCVAGTWCVNTNFNLKCPISWPNFADHTPTGIGNFLIIDGSTSQATNVWSTLLNVIPGAAYTFSFWVASVYPNTSQVFDLGMMVNNTNVKQITINQLSPAWVQYTFTGVCPAGVTLLPIAIRQISGGAFRDFGIDDIEFISCNCDADFTFKDTSGCGGFKFTNFSTGAGGLTYSWSFGDPASGLSNSSTSINPSHQFSSCGNFNVCLKITARDGCTDSICKTVSYFDLVKPSIICPKDLTVSCNASVNPTNTGFATATDNCMNTSAIGISFSDVLSGAYPCNALFTRIWIATDACKNSSSCVQLIKIKDTIPPKIICPKDITVQCTDDTNPSTTGTATATDDCTLPSSIIILGADKLTGTLPCNATITRTWTAEDDCGNKSKCIQIIIVKDNTPPKIKCPKDITLQCPSNTAPSNTGTATATDNCTPTASIMINATELLVGTLPCDGTITRTWKATDECGNASTCKQIIKVKDTISPTISCPRNPTVNTNPGVCYFTGTYPSATGKDSCDPSPSIVCSLLTTSSSILITANTQYPKGINTITCYAIDACGNQSKNCTFTLTVEDHEAPKITCPLSISVLGEWDSLGNCKAIVKNIVPIVTDNCPMLNVSYTLTGATSGLGITDASGTTFMSGITTVHYTVIDMAGNKDTCSFTIKVICESKWTCPCNNGTAGSQNLVINGNFNNNITGFTNDFAYFSPITAIGQYSVLTNTQVPIANSQWACSDHTTGTGSFLVVDGASTTGNNVAWRQTIPGSDSGSFNLCFYVNNIVKPDRSYDDPVIGVFIKSGTGIFTQIIPNTLIQENPDAWVPFNATWIGKLPATIEIRTMTNQSIGNDFAIDDISFTQCEKFETSPCDSLNNGLVGYFPFLNNTDDASTTAINGTLIGSPPPNLTIGAQNNAYHFNGSGHYIDISTNDRNITNEVSIMAWVKTTAKTPQWIAGKYEFSVDHGYGIAIGDNANGSVGKVAIGGRDGTLTYHSSGFSNDTVNDGQWHCITGVVGKGLWRIYIDGILQNSSPGTSINLASGAIPFTIGAFTGTNSGTPLNMNGDIDNVLVYNRVISPAEIKCLCMGSEELGVCRCGSFINLSARLTGGAQNQSIQCGKTYTLKCPTVFQFSGDFKCQGDGCDSSKIVWNINGPIVKGGSFSAFTGFTLPLNAQSFSINGLYTLTLIGYCDGKPCPPCKIYFEVTGCNNCCKDSTTFNNTVANLHTNGALGDCIIFENGTGLDSCMQLTWSWGDNSTTGPVGNATQVSHIYSGTNTYNVCYLIEEVGANGKVCHSYKHCDSIYVICDSCECAGADHLSFGGGNGFTIPVKCGNTTSGEIPCDPDGHPFYFHGNVKCKGDSCLGDQYNWIIKDSLGNNVISGIDALHIFNANTGHFDILNLVPTMFIPGKDYTITVTWYCGGKLCTCDIKFHVKACDCHCGKFTNVFIRPTHGAPSIPVFCDNDAPPVPCPIMGQPFNISGQFICDGDYCPSTANVNWMLIDPMGNKVDSGSIVANPGWSLNLNNHHFGKAGTYTLMLSGHCGSQVCSCKIRFTFKEACPCDDCTCGKYSNMFIRSGQGVSKPVACGDSAVTINCPPNGQDVVFSGQMLCQGEGCPKSTTLDWILLNAQGLPIANGNNVPVNPNFTVHISPLLLTSTGIYTLQLIGHCGAQRCTCEVKVRMEKPCDDKCQCDGFSILSAISRGPIVTKNCGDTIYVPEGLKLFFSIAFNCKGVCPPFPPVVSWSLVGPAGYRPTGGNATATPNLNLGIDETTFTLPGTYTLTMIGHCGNKECTCKITFITPAQCCQDKEIFCQNVMNAINVSVDNSKCKATLSINNLSQCDYIEKISWGNGKESLGPFTNGDMPMYTYNTNGTYIISYIVVETDPATGEYCFVKLFRDTINVKCGPIGTLIPFDRTIVNKNLNVYPNPNFGSFVVDLPQSATAGTIIRIIGLTGQVLYEKNAMIGIKEQSISATTLPEGLYFIQVFSDGQPIAIQKFIKQQ